MGPRPWRLQDAALSANAGHASDAIEILMAFRRRLGLPQVPSVFAYSANHVACPLDCQKHPVERADLDVFQICLQRRTSKQDITVRTASSEGEVYTISRCLREGGRQVGVLAMPMVMLGNRRRLRRLALARARLPRDC